MLHPRFAKEEPFDLLRFRSRTSELDLLRRAKRKRRRYHALQAGSLAVAERREAAAHLEQLKYDEWQTQYDHFQACATAFRCGTAGEPFTSPMPPPCTPGHETEVRAAYEAGLARPL